MDVMLLIFLFLLLQVFVRVRRRCRIRCPASCTLGTSAPCMRRVPPMVSSARWGMSVILADHCVFGTLHTVFGWKEITLVVVTINHFVALTKSLFLSQFVASICMCHRHQSPWVVIEFRLYSLQPMHMLYIKLFSYFLTIFLFVWSTFQ